MDRPVPPRPDGSAERAVGAPPSEPVAPPRIASAGEPAPDPVDRLLALVRDEMTRPTNARLQEIEPGRWWLGDPADREAAAIPLADRVEWAVFSLLSTAGPLSEPAFFERIATLFTGHDLPDEGLVRACLDSYRSMASTPDRLVTERRPPAAQPGAHRRCWRRSPTPATASGCASGSPAASRRRRIDGELLGDRLDRREQRAYLGAHQPGRRRSSSDVDCIWYIRGKVALLFEVEWTAMLGEPLLRRHDRIPADDTLVRFLVIAPERTELVRYKLDRSPLLRAALEHGDFHIIKSTTCAGSSPPSNRTSPTSSRSSASTR